MKTFCDKILIACILLLASNSVFAQNSKTSVDLGFGSGNSLGPSFLFNLGTSMKHHYVAFHISSSSQAGNKTKATDGKSFIKYNDRFSEMGLLYGFNSNKNKNTWTYLAIGPSFYYYVDKYIVTGATKKELDNDKYSGAGALVQFGLIHPFKKKNAMGLTAYSNFTKEGYVFNFCLTLLFGKFKDL